MALSSFRKTFRTLSVKNLAKTTKTIYSHFSVPLSFHHQISLETFQVMIAGAPLGLGLIQPFNNRTLTLSDAHAKRRQAIKLAPGLRCTPAHLMQKRG